MTQNNINTINPVVQIIRSNTTAQVTCNSFIPQDNTIPQSGEGVEVLTATITPKSATNLLEIEFNAWGWVSITLPTCAALFQDAGANALAAAVGNHSFVNNACSSIFLRHIMAAGTTSSTTFKIRSGPLGGAATFWINATNITALFGGVASCYLVIKEYSV